MREAPRTPVIEMKRPFGLLGDEFGPFLYASVGNEGNGMMLSVLSTLARRDLDPWKEAAELAVLPVDIAAKRLATLIAGLPGTTGCLDVGKTANRLILLLPQQSNSTTPQRATVPDATGLTTSSLVIWVITMGLIMGAQAIAASREQPAPTAQSHPSTTTTIAPVKGPPDSSQSVR